MISMVSSFSVIEKHTYSALGTRIIGDYLCGNSEFIWSDDENLLLSLRNSVLTLSGGISDCNEFDEFLKLISPVAIICDGNQNISGYSIIQDGVLMKKHIDGDLAPINPDNSFRLREYYEIFVNSGMIIDYEGFCLDMSSFVRKSAGFVDGTYVEGKLAAAIAVSAISDKSAIINAVAVDEKFRRKGLGSAIMLRAQRRLCGRDAFVFREKDKNEVFYSQMGFHNCGEWKILQKNKRSSA